MSIAIIILFFPLTATAAEPEVESNENAQKIKQLDELSQQLYKATTSKEYMQARKLLDQMSAIVLKLDDAPFKSVEGMEAYINAIVKARRLFNALNFNGEEAVLATARLRFASDALVHPNKPLWLNYYSVMKEDLDNLRDAREREDYQAALVFQRNLSTHFSIIQPAVMITRGAPAVEKVNSILVFIGQQMKSESTFRSNLNSGLENLYYAIEELFLKEKNTLGPMGGMMVPISVTVGIAAVIVTVLTFVAWKKFHGGDKPVIS